jgi:PfaD family protein
VRYRAAGLSRNAQSGIEIENKIIAKLSRREVAEKFMSPAPERILRQLRDQGLITAEQAELAAQVPVADDITVESDSGGHTDNRPLVGLLPSILALRDEIQEQYDYPTPIRVGAAGGISTPSAALGAFMMGAAYVVSGSVNQGCLEAGASPHTKKLLAEADMADVIMAPAADMFEMGVKVQVLKRGTLFAMRAQKLYDLYQQYESVEAIPAAERERVEKQIFRRGIDEVWADTMQFFTERDPEQITRANNNPKRKMALIFRWYLGLSSRWSNVGEQGREVDYQIWCGPSMGAFNSWVRGSYLEKPENRRVADVAHHIMTGAAYLYRVQSLKMQGAALPTSYLQYRPEPPTQRSDGPAAAAKPTAEATPAESAPAPAAATPQPNMLAEDDRDAEAIQAWLVTNVAKRLGTDPDEIDVREPFDNYNLDSAQVLILASELEEWMGFELSPTLLWNYPTIEKLAQRLATMKSAPQVGI